VSHYVIVAVLSVRQPGGRPDRPAPGVPLYGACARVCGAPPAL